MSPVLTQETGAAAAISPAQRPRVFLMNESLNTGGTERQFVVTAAALKADFDVSLGCTNLEGELAGSVDAITEFAPGDSLISRQAWKASRKLTRHLRQHGIQIAHSFDYYGNMLLIPSARAARVPVVIGSHRGLGDLFGPRRQLAQSYVFRLADAIVCNCNAAAERLVEYGLPRRKLVIIPNFIPDEVFAPCAPALPRKDGGLRLGMVGRMNHPVKNFPLLLRAVARLVKQFENLEAILVGDGVLRPSLEAMAQELGLSGCVRFLGNRRDVPAILRSLDVAVLTSDSEGLSNAILEAMACGLPVVASRVGGNIELVEEERTGFLFAPGREEDLVAALEKLLANTDLRRGMGEEARARALATYGMSAVLAQFKHLYLTLLQAKGVV